MAKKENTEKKENVNKSVASWSKMNLPQLKAEYEKLIMDIKLGKEANTSLSKKLRRMIAREVTKLSQAIESK